MYVVVGSPQRGLVGLGRGRGTVMQKAGDQAFHRGEWTVRPKAELTECSLISPSSGSHSHCLLNRVSLDKCLLDIHAQNPRRARALAVLSMDYVNKYENRTLWGQGNELTRKFGSSLVKMRARPPGEYLDCP